MRVQNLDGTSHVDDLKEFGNWLACIGDGKINEPNDGVATIDIPKKYLIEKFDDPVCAIIERVYFDYLGGRNDCEYFGERAILAPTLDVVNMVNNYMVALNHLEEKTYLSSDLPAHSDGSSNIFVDLHTPEFLSTVSLSGLPEHSLNLKVGTLVMLLRNIDPSIGLCNGTRLLITRLGNHVLEGEVLSAKNGCGKVLIPRMSLTPSDSRIPFRFERRQFPQTFSYAMTINKSQGQSLNVVVLLLKKPVFCHGQLYVALSRVTNPSGLNILICGEENSESSNSTTTNVVFKEVFNNV